MTPLAASNTLVRGWTHLYTWRLPAMARDTRRAEIESDLWELAHDVDRPDALAPALLVLARLVRGIPDDLQWRASHVTIGTAPMRAAISIGAMAMALLAVWVYTISLPTELPSPAPLVRFVQFAPPPPPPPPPPPRRLTRR